MARRRRRVGGREAKQANRFVWTMIIIVAAVLLVTFWDWWSEGWEAKGALGESLYQGVPLDTHLLALDKTALEEAYKQHVILLFSVWLKDDVNVVHRINRGLANGRRAYQMAAQKIEERERAK